MTVFRCALAIAVAWITVSPVLSAEASDSPTILTVVGAPGDPEYGEQFQQWAHRWKSAAKQAGATSIRIGTAAESKTSDKEQLEKALAEQAEEATAPIWIVLIGHGTFDGRIAKFNLRGPDVSATELAQWFSTLERPIVVVNCASSSGPFINKLSRKDRVVITAAKSGFEMNFARFGDYLSAAIIDAAADLDKDGQSSLLEAFLFASAHVREFYQQEARLATEQALLDDNGDGRGTPATFFRGIHPIRKAKNGAALDGSRAHQLLLVPNDAERSMPPQIRAHRDQLEQEIAELRQQKDQLEEEVYYAQLERLLVEFARLYRDLQMGDREETQAK